MLKFENVTHRHKDGILNLWNNHSGWGPVTWEQINSWKVSPYEEVIHGVAIDENEVIIGQIVFSFCRVRYNNELVKAGRILAPVVNKDVIKNFSIRKRSHPILQLYKWIFDEAAKRSVEIVYMYPSVKWRPLLGLAPRLFKLPKLVGNVYHFFTIKCDHYNSFENNDYHFKSAESYSDLHNQLWKSCMSRYQNHLAIEREADYLAFKAGSELKLEIWKGKDLVALLIYNNSRNLIHDLFIKPGFKYAEVIESALHVLGTEFLTNGAEVKFLGTECMMEYFDGFEINKIDYSQLFAWTSLSSKFDLNSNWYLTSLS